MLQQPEQRQGYGALARAAFSHQAQDLAFTDFDFDVAQYARLVRVVDGQARVESRLLIAG